MESDDILLLETLEEASLNSREPSPCPSDQCIIAIDDDIETAQLNRKEISDYDLELAGKIPPLPENKDRHLFVSYSSEDFDDVMAIVNQLEQRFHVSCIISARDFQSGKDIIANIKDSMNRSMKNVFMLTPNFVQSGFCKFERDVAFMTSIQTGINNVIPIMLHECDVPTSLSTVTYIDAMLPGIDVPAKIIEALIQSELADAALSFEECTLSRKYENGFCVTFQTRPEKVCWGLKPPIYRLRLAPEDITRLQQARIKLPVELLEIMIQRLNESSLVRLYDLTRSRSKLCCRFSFPFLIWMFSCVTLSKYGFMVAYNMDFLPVFMSGVFFFLLALCVSLIMACTMPFCCNNRKKEVSLQMHVWEAVSDQCLQYNCIPIVQRSRKMPPTLNIMRYNTKECQTYLAGLIRSRGSPSEDETPEEKAEAMIKRSIFHLIHHLTPNLEELPDAPCNRHHVRKSKMCLCQMIEAEVPLVNGPESIV